MSYKLLSNTSLLFLIKCLNATHHKQMHVFLPVLLNVNNLGEKIKFFITQTIIYSSIMKKLVHELNIPSYGYTIITLSYLHIFF